MATKDITVNITLNGEIDVEKIAEAVRKEIERIGVKVEVAPEPAKLKVGDYAKVINDSETNIFEIGDIVRITVVDRGKWDYEAKSIEDDRNEQFFARELGSLSDKEVEEVLRQQAEAIELARWSKIGRTQSQYKVGDIVRYKDDKEIVEVVGITEFKFPEVQTHWSGICEEHFNNIELITPVEARFDLENGGSRE